MAQKPQNVDTLRGFGLALTAYLLWGFLPFFMKQLAHIPPVEVVAHRVIWSLPIAGVVLWLRGGFGTIGAVFRSPRMLGMGLITACLISVNWGVYVWAIGTGHALDAALGYYINPLFSIFLAAVLLGERLSRAQVLAIGLAGLAVAVLTWEAGRLPFVALALTLSWGFYAYFKRSLPIGANEGFLLEILILTPPAYGYVIWLAWQGTGHFMDGVVMDSGLLVACGAVTAVPMMIYANGAKLLRLSTIGIMQYIAPSMIFVIAVFVFGEPFGQARLVAFVMIWTGLVIYTSAMLRQARAVKGG